MQPHLAFQRKLAVQCWYLSPQKKYTSSQDCSGQPMAYVTAAHSIVKALQGDNHGSHTVQQHQYASCTRAQQQALEQPQNNSRGSNRCAPHQLPNGASSSGSRPQSAAVPAHPELLRVDVGHPQQHRRLRVQKSTQGGCSGAVLQRRQRPAPCKSKCQGPPANCNSGGGP